MDTRTPARLTRSNDDRLLGGVAGGLATFLGLDPTLVRVGFVLLTFFGGSGIVLYAALWLIVPPDDDELRPVDASVRAGVGEIRDAAKGLAGDVRSGWARRDEDPAPPVDGPVEDAVDEPTDEASGQHASRPG